MRVGGKSSRAIEDVFELGRRREEGGGRKKRNLSIRNESFELEPASIALWKAQS